MKADYTHIVVLLDNSGSMGSIANDVIGGFNTFIEEQKKEKGEATITLVEFNTTHSVIYDKVALTEVPTMTKDTYKTLGSTALNDSMAKTITSTGATLSAMKEDDRPDGVLFVTITDGEENMSREFTGAKVKEMVKHQEEKYNWKFIYIGANQDSFSNAATVGTTLAMNFMATSDGVGTMFKKMSKNSTSYRSSRSFDADLQVTPVEAAPTDSTQTINTSN
jgi:uncharacterized protein YegL